MRHYERTLLLGLAAVLLSSNLNNSFAASSADNWGQWRGPEHNGVSRTATPPIEWSEEKNVQWKAAIPGSGNSAPIVWGDKVFVLTAIDTGAVDPLLPKPEDQPQRVFGIKHPNTTHSFFVLCLDRNTGREIWRRKATDNIPHQGRHKDASFASSSPITDGERLYCWFGSTGLFCFDLDGKLLWQRNLGKVHVGASLGEGTSPALFDGRLVIVRDHSRQSYIETLDARTGDTLWKKDRDEDNTWATPAIVKHSGRTQVITTGSTRIRSYDLNSGNVIWECGGLTGNAIPCPVVQEDHVICMTGYKGHAALAIPLSSTGDITDSKKTVWSHDRGTPYIPSPLLYDGLVWFNQSNQGLWTCVDANTGEAYVDRERLPGIRNMYSSPVGADGRIYATGRSGTTLVLARSKELKVLATNKLEDSINSSAALAGDQLFLRGDRFLYCLSEKAKTGRPKVIELKGADRATRPTAARPAGKAMNGPNAKLLAKIDKNFLPAGYEGGAKHQPFVDAVMKKFTPEQRGRLGQLWAEKVRTDLKMPNRGQSFVRILAYVAEGESAQNVGRAVVGKAIFQGPRPRREGLGMDEASRKLHKDPPLDENVLIGKDGSLANVFIQVKKGLEKKEHPAPSKPVLIDQIGSIFRPRVTGVMIGQKFITRNSDPYIHNVRSLSLKNRAFNIAQPPKTADRERVFKRKEGPIQLGCDFHKWMKAYLFVMDHPYFATTDERGRFRIEGLPAGEYTLEAWHEEFGKRQAQITVDANGAANTDFTFEPE